MLAAQGSVFAASTDKVYTTDNEKSIDFGKTFLGHVYGYGDADNLKTFDFADLFGGTVVEPTTYAVTVNAGENGSAVADVTEAKEGDTVTLTVDPDEGYELDEITGVTATMVDDTTYTFTMPGNAVTINVTFKAIPAPTYAVTVNAGANGSANADVTEAKEGDIITITVDPDEGYELDEITGVTATMVDDTTYTFTMPGEAVTVNVTFVALPVEDTDTAPVYPGEEPFTKTFKFEELFGGTVVEPTLYAITVGVGANGRAYTDVISAKEGDTVTLTVDPDEGYELNEITGVTATKVNDTTYTFTMPAEAVTINVSFKEIPVVIEKHNVSVGTVENGTVTLSATGEVDENTVVTVTATPAEGYQLVEILVNGTAIDGTTFTVTEEAVVTATFEALPVETDRITIPSAKNGKVTVDKEAPAAGEEVTITVDPDKGYELKKLEVKDSEGNDVTVTDNKFTMPENDITISAEFEAIEYKVEIEVGKNGDAEFTVEGEEVEIAVIGDDIDISVDPNKNYTLKKITYSYVDEKGNTKTVTVRNKTFKMPAYDVVIEVTFEKKATSSSGSGGSGGGLGIILPSDGTLTPEETITEIIFDDVAEGTWYEADIDYVAEKGIMTGVADRTFDPNGVVTRAMVVATLQRLEAPYYENTNTPFTDVAADAWYAKSVAWAYENGIVKGMSDTEYAPDALVTREQLAAILDRYVDAYHKEIDATADISGYVDSALVSDWAVESVASAVGMGIISGTDAGELNPLGNATRAEYATMLSRCMRKIGK